MPEIKETDVEDLEQFLNYPNATATMEFQQNAYFSMVILRVHVLRHSTSKFQM